MIKRGLFFLVFALVLLFSKGIAGAEESFLSILKVSVSQGDTTVSVGATVTSALGVQEVKAELYAGEEKITEFQLFDDGKHNDGSARDERWGGSLDISELPPGAYDIVLQARNRKGGVETSRGHQFLTAEPSRVVLGGQSEESSSVLTEEQAKEQSREDSEVLGAMIETFLAHAPAGGALANNSSELQFKCYDERIGHSESCTNDFAVIQWRAPKQAVCTAHTNSPGLKSQWSGQKKYVGSLSIGPLSATTTLEMKCLGGGVSALAPSTTVTIVPVNTRRPLPALLCQQADGTFSRGPCMNSRAVLSWGPSPDTEFCTASASPASSFWRGSKPAQGTQDVEVVDVEKVFTLTCRNPLGIVKESVVMRPTLKKALPLIQKGTTASKIDVVFVGEGFADTREFDALVREVYAEGFEKFSPFREHTSVFNIWTVRGEDLVATPADTSCASLKQQDFINAVRLHNPFADKVVFVSKKVFRSCAYINGDSFNSFGDALADSVIDEITPGQALATLFMHEFGHSFGGLADEYVESGKPSIPRIPNCLGTFHPTPLSWTESEGTKHSSFTLVGTVETLSEERQGCSYVAENRRPTPHSIMRFHFGGGNPFGPVNEERILTRILPFENRDLFLFSPRGGESWPRGSRQVIRWVTKNTGISKVELINDAAQILELPVVTDTDNAYVFTVPSSIPIGNYFVKVYSGTSTAQSSGQITVVPAITGVLQVLQGSYGDTQVVSAGQKDVFMGNIFFVATHEPIVLERLALQMSNSSAFSLPQNIEQVKIYDGQTLVGTASFVGSNRFATSTLVQRVDVPTDSYKILTVRADLSPIGLSSSGAQGARIQIDFDGTDSTGTQGTGVITGNRINHSAVGDTAFSGVRVYKSFPVITYSTTTAPANNGSNDLLTISVRADSKGQVQLRKLTFLVSTSTARLTAPTFIGPNGSVGSAQLSRSGTEDIITVTFDNESNVEDRTIFTGQTKQYVLRGSISLQGLNNTGTVSVSLKSDFQHGVVGRMGNVADLASSRMIWSPNATTTASIIANDWANSFGLPGCFTASGIQANCPTRTIGVSSQNVIAQGGVCIQQDPNELPLGVVSRFTAGSASIGGQLITYPGQSFSWYFEGDVDFYLRRVAPSTTGFLEAFYAGDTPNLVDRVKIGTASYYDTGAAYAGASSTVLGYIQHSTARGCQDLLGNGSPVRASAPLRAKFGAPISGMRPVTSSAVKK